MSPWIGGVPRFGTLRKIIYWSAPVNAARVPVLGCWGAGGAGVLVLRCWGAGAEVLVLVLVQRYVGSRKRSSNAPWVAN
jgi:hypothetical protein